MEAVPTAACERARTWASLALDCELSELERAHLRAHLAECESCGAFVSGLREVTHELRTAPLPAPSRPLGPRTRSRIPLVLAAVAIVVAAVVGGFAGSLRPVPAPAQVTVTGVRLAALFTAQLSKLPGSRLPQQTAV
jgi:predicted anti-sigma-YlaC factor YlaD